MQMQVHRPSHKRKGSLLVEECSFAIGNTTSLKRTTSIWKTKLPELKRPGLDENMDITTVSEQGVHGISQTWR